MGLVFFINNLSLFNSGSNRCSFFIINFISFPGSGNRAGGNNQARIKSVDRVNAGGNGQFADDRSVLVNRVLSANRNKAKALHNVIFELQKHIEHLTVENKDLKRAARMQDRELKKLDNAEAELPQLMKKHSEELRVVQEKYRRQKESADKARDSLKKREEDLSKTQDKLRKYQKMVKDKNLLEKNNLSKKVEELEKQVEERNNKISVSSGTLPKMLLELSIVPSRQNH